MMELTPLAHALNVLGIIGKLGLCSISDSWPNFLESEESYICFERG